MDILLVVIVVFCLIVGLLVLEAHRISKNRTRQLKALDITIEHAMEKMDREWYD